MTISKTTGVAMMLLLFWVTGAMDSRTTPVIAQTPIDPWMNYPPESVVYAEVISIPDAIYFRHSAEDTPAQWERSDNNLLYEGAIEVAPRYRYLSLHHIVRIKVYDDTWGQILPDGQYSPYIPDPLRFHPTYIRLAHLNPLSPSAFSPITVYSTTQNADKLIFILLDDTPRMVLFEGKTPVMHVPLIMGSVPSTGDFRVYRTRVSDDLDDIAAAPYSHYFTGDYPLHGSPWWNWAEVIQGGYGGYGGVNMPDVGWYPLLVGDKTLTVAQWVYRWISSNLDYDESDPNSEEAIIQAGDSRWYQSTGSVRLMIVRYLEDLNKEVVTQRFGGAAALAQVSDWQEIIDAYRALGDDWLITNLPNGQGSPEILRYPADQSLAQRAGQSDHNTWIMLNCTDRQGFDEIAYVGSSRTVGKVCYHLAVERQGSICTPERVDPAFLGKRVLCDGRRFYAKSIEERGYIITHERVHLIQFSGYFGDLARQGIAADDPSPTELDFRQLSTIGLTELMAQTRNQGTPYADDYTFVLVRSNANGALTIVNNWATTEQAWAHLHRQCGDLRGNDVVLRAQLEQAFMGNAAAYQALNERCSLPLHQLIPDRYRGG